jgi:ankyrin repeat protein
MSQLPNEIIEEILTHLPDLRWKRGHILSSYYNARVVAKWLVRHVPREQLLSELVFQDELCSAVLLSLDRMGAMSAEMWRDVCEGAMVVDSVELVQLCVDVIQVKLSEEVEFDVMAYLVRKRQEELATRLFTRTQRPQRVANQLLLKAAENKCPNMVQAMIQHGADVNYLNGAPLVSAVGSDVTTLHKLLLNGANPHASDNGALCEASLQGHSAAVALLLSFGANVHSRNSFPICFASLNGHMDVVRLLIDAGADVNARQGAPLACSGHSGHSDLVQLLLEKGANPLLGGEDALRGGASIGDVHIVDSLVSHGVDVNGLSEFSLRVCCEQGHFEMLRYLVEEMHCDVNALDGHALRLCARNGHVEILRYLCERGADIRALEPDLAYYPAKTLQFLASVA